MAQETHLDTVLTVLKNHFSYEKIPYEGSKFHQKQQEQEERIEQFITHLRELPSFCEYTERNF